MLSLRSWMAFLGRAYPFFQRMEYLRIPDTAYSPDWDTGPLQVTNGGQSTSSTWLKKPFYLVVTPHR